MRNSSLKAWPRTGKRKCGLKKLLFELLTQPLKTQGILRFTPPTGLEKHITAPYDERYLVEGDTVLVESKTKETNRALSLHDYPALRAFIDALRSTQTNYAAVKGGSTTPRITYTGGRLPWRESSGVAN